MRFVLGFAIGFGIGFAGAVLLAPEKKRQREWLPGDTSEAAQNHDAPGLSGVIESVRRRVDEAMNEAKEARTRAEREMTERYERSAGRDTGS